MTGRRLRIGLVGCGYISRVHLQAWDQIPRADVVALCDSDTTRLASRQSESGIAAGFADLAAMLAGVDLDALDICTRPDTHRILVELGAQAGKHMLVQKPFAETTADAEAMCQATEAAGVVLMVKENFRWYPWYQALKQAITDGLAGEVRRLQIRREVWGSPDPEWQVWQEQGYFQQMDRALWFDVGVHMVDVQRFLLGDPVTVFAAMNRVSPLLKGEDTAHVVLRFPKAFGTCDLSWAVRGRPARSGVDRVRLDGTKGSLELGSDGTLVLRNNYGGWRSLPVDMSQAELRSHLGSQRNFIRAVFGEEPPATGGRHNLRTLYIALAAYESAEVGHSVALS